MITGKNLDDQARFAEGIGMQHVSRLRINPLPLHRCLSLYS
jgi:hypothetical protein